MSKEELDKHSLELKKELIKLRSQVAMGTSIENPGRIRSIRRTLAMIITLLKNKERKEASIKV